MTDITKSAGHTDDVAVDKKKKKGAPTEVCEICGQVMERDPEGGEYFCPDCDYADDRP
jgi:transposase